MNRSERETLIERYREGFSIIARAVDGLSQEELDFKPAIDEWTPREIVHHLADSEMTSAVRLRRLIAEQSPVIYGYDEEEFAKKLHYDRPIAPSLEAIKAARQTTAEILERLSEEDWGREGTHSEVGVYSVEKWLEIYAAHAHDHAGQIRAVLKRRTS